MIVRQGFEVTNWVSRSDGAEDQPYDILILRLLPTYEAPVRLAHSGFDLCK